MSIVIQIAKRTNTSLNSSDKKYKLGNKTKEHNNISHSIIFNENPIDYNNDSISNYSQILPKLNISQISKISKSDSKAEHSMNNTKKSCNYYF